MTGATQEVFYCHTRECAAKFWGSKQHGNQDIQNWYETMKQNRESGVDPSSWLSAKAPRESLGKGSPDSRPLWGSCTSVCRTIKLQPCLIPVIKMNQKYLKVKFKTSQYEMPRRKIQGKCFRELNTARSLQGKTSKSREINQKLGKCGFTKL